MGWHEDTNRTKATQANYGIQCDCGSNRTYTIDSRGRDYGRYRRYKCHDCGAKLTTVEHRVDYDIECTASKLNLQASYFAQRGLKKIGKI